MLKKRLHKKDRKREYNQLTVGNAPTEQSSGPLFDPDCFEMLLLHRYCEGLGNGVNGAGDLEEFFHKLSIPYDFISEPADFATSFGGFTAVRFALYPFRNTESARDTIDLGYCLSIAIVDKHTNTHRETSFLYYGV